jgi:hypothetical protein
LKTETGHPQGGQFQAQSSEWLTCALVLAKKRVTADVKVHKLQKNKNPKEYVVMTE